MKTQMKSKVFDFSSNQPHVLCDCPLCKEQWQQRVQLGIILKTPCKCSLDYLMTKKPTGGIELKFTISLEQAKAAGITKS